jgi:glycosyltransferase involved in cell wall biosynthesis
MAPRIVTAERGFDSPLPAEGTRVLLICDWFLKYTAGLARGLADVGCEVTLLSRDHDMEFGDEPGAMREFVARTLDGKARHLELGGRVRDVSRFRDMWRLRGGCRRWAPHVVHIQDSLPHDMRLAVAGGFPWQKYAFTVHDPAPHPGEPRRSARIRIVRRALRRGADLVFAHSPVLVDELRAADEIRGTAVVVPHGVADLVAAPLPAIPSLLFFGRITHYKGVDTLLDAMPAVWERRPDVTLTVAGSGELPDHPTLADPRVALRAEHVPEAAVSDLYAGSTCVVLPYRQASQSGVGSEAKQHGRAIIATAVGGLPDLVSSDCGRLVPPEDPAALAEAIVEVVGTPGLAAELGRRATASVDDAGWRSVGAQTLAAYRRYLL